MVLKPLLESRIWGSIQHISEVFNNNKNNNTNSNTNSLHWLITMRQVFFQTFYKHKLILITTLWNKEVIITAIFINEDLKLGEIWVICPGKQN